MSSASSVETSVLPSQGDGQQNVEDSAQPSTETSVAVDEPSPQGEPGILPQMHAKLSLWYDFIILAVMARVRDQRISYSVAC